MKKSKMGPKKKTPNCHMCGQPFDDIGMNNWQGHNCASYVDYNLIRCCYGSTLDGNVYLIKKYIDSDIVNLCDQCIVNMESNGDIVLVCELDLFGNYTYTEGDEIDYR